MKNQPRNPFQSPVSVLKAQLAGISAVIARQRNYGYASSRYRPFCPQSELFVLEEGFEMGSTDHRLQFTEIYQISDDRLAGPKPICQMLLAKSLPNTTCYLLNTTGGAS